jgi:hypothetical protein
LVGKANEKEEEKEEEEEERGKCIIPQTCKIFSQFYNHRK